MTTSLAGAFVSVLRLALAALPRRSPSVPIARAWGVLAALGALTSGGAAGAAFDFPGPAPGSARARQDERGFVLENNLLSTSWAVVDGRLRPVSSSNCFSSQSVSQANTELFRLTVQSPTGTVAIAAADCSTTAGPQFQPCAVLPQSPRAGDHFGGWELRCDFLHAGSGLTVSWRAVLRDGANYLRQQLTLRASQPGWRLRQVEALDHATAMPPVPTGAQAGNPWTAGQSFLATESPFAVDATTDGRFRGRLNCDLALEPGRAFDFSSVVGVFPTNQLRRAFLHYLERERARSYGPMLNWNSWFDTLVWVSEARVAEVMHTLDRELRQQRGIAVESFAVDDCWDDPVAGFWAVDSQRFPNGFDALADQARALDSHLAVWISPLCGYPYTVPYGYDLQAARVAAGVRAGLFAGGPDLSIPAYYDWWVARCQGLVRNQRVNYLKWDRAGSWDTPAHFMALMRAAGEVRSAGTNLFLNVTVGTWPSPFWLFFADTIWRGESDLGFTGEGDARERWLTYRDAVTWQGAVQGAPLFPLNSLMLHGLVHARAGFAESIAASGTDLRHEARSFFGSGTQLQELYLTPELMTSNSWDQIAGAIRWSRTNADLLVDTHWVGGDPGKLEVYGWAAWGPAKSSLVLRNPASRPNGLEFDLGAALELPDGSPRLYELRPAYADQRPVRRLFQAGKRDFLALDPFEVLAFEVVPAVNFHARTAGLQPLAWWRFAETNNPVRDWAGRADATCVGADSGVRGGVLMDGDEGMARFPTPGSAIIATNFTVGALAGSNDFTLVLLVNFDNFPTGAEAMPLLQGANSGGVAEPDFAFEVVGNSRLRWQLLGLAAAELQVPQLESNRWYQLAVARAGAAIRFFVNGSETGSASLGAAPASGTALVLGGEPREPDGRSFTGMMDEFVVFNRALGLADLASLYDASAGALSPPLIVQAPAATTVFAGFPAVLRVVAGGTGPLLYQWECNGLPVAGATGSVLRLENVASGTNGPYTVTVRNLAGAVHSQPVTVQGAALPPTLAAVLPDEPLALWRLDESARPVIADLMRRRDGMATEALRFGEQGALLNDGNRAIGFPGSANTGIALPPVLLSATGAFSLEAWCRVSGGSHCQRVVFSCLDTGRFSGFAVTAGTDDRWQFISGNGEAWETLSGPVLAGGQWTHVVATFDGTSKKLFVNARQTASEFNRIATPTNAAWQIGCAAASDAGGFAGTLDEIAVYGHALTRGRIEAHYLANALPACVAGDGSISITRLTADVLLAWPDGTVQESSSPQGPWGGMPEATSPLLVPIAGAQKFFRAVR